MRVYRFTVNSDRDPFTIAILLYDRASGNFWKAAPMLNHLRRFLKDQSGTAAVEYGLLTSGIAAAVIPSIKDVGTKLVGVFSAIQSALN